AGNDSLFGGAGADTFRFGKGYGTDLIGSADVESNRLDTADLIDIQSSEVTFSRVSDDLVINLTNFFQPWCIGQHSKADQICRWPGL
ncbi:hypothetical protein, partial [Pseudomonas syringae]|uniref:hypothetical protein n=1 Tax=Pseudomonas syringae TaxID=317 RepID=UPI0018A14352